MQASYMLITFNARGAHQHARARALQLANSPREHARLIGLSWINYRPHFEYLQRRARRASRRVINKVASALWPSSNSAWIIWRAPARQAGPDN